MDLINYDILSIKKMYFRDCDINEDFFASLKSNYPGFEEWFARKHDEQVYIHRDDNGKIQGFLYLKKEGEEEDYSDFESPFKPGKRLKIGTFKISENGYYMGERFFKVIFENAIKNGLGEIYVTIFSHHTLLIDYFKRFGFKEITSKLSTGELVFVRNLERYEDNEYQGYPILNIKNKRFFILPIRPEYHTRLLPDAILRTEDNANFIYNNKASNAIKKVYFGKNLWAYKPNIGDIVFFYRTKDYSNSSPAHYQSVITSVGTVLNYGIANELNTNELDKLLSKCVLEESIIKDIKENSSYYRFLEFIYFGKLDYRKVNLAYMRSYGIEAPRGLKLISDTFAHDVLEQSGYSEGIIIK